MVVDDIISDVLNVVAASAQDFQPAEGVEIVLTNFAANSSNARFTLIDGTVNAAGIKAGGGQTTMTQFKIGITNTIFLRMDPSSGTVQHAFTGIQTK